MPTACWPRLSSDGEKWTYFKTSKCIAKPVAATNYDCFSKNTLKLDEDKVDQHMGTRIKP